MNATAKRLLPVLLLIGNGVLADPGDFDPSFNGLGFTRDFIPDFSTDGSSVAIHSGGQIVTSGTYIRIGDFFQPVIWRHLADGSLDTSFGGTGIIYPVPPAPDSVVAGDSLAIDSQNRIVLVTVFSPNFVVYRFNFDGSPDLTFAGTGSTTIRGGNSVFGLTHVLALPDDKILGVGGAINPASGRWEFVVYRLLETGELDPAFGGTGFIYTVMTPGGGFDRATGAALQPDGKIVVAGRARSLSGPNFNYALARYLPSGALDPDFGTDGKVVFPVLDINYGRRVVIQPDGKIVIIGSVCRDLVETLYCYSGAARVDERGTLDPTFGGTGKVYTDLGYAGASVYDVVLQAGNNIVLCGIHQFDFDANVYNAILLRYRSDGSLDPTFGLNGVLETNFGYAQNGIGSIAQQGDGQIVAAGGTRGSRIIAVTARYLSTGMSSQGAPRKPPPDQRRAR